MSAEEEAAGLLGEEEAQGLEDSDGAPAQRGTLEDEDEEGGQSEKADGEDAGGEGDGQGDARGEGEGGGDRKVKKKKKKRKHGDEGEGEGEDRKKHKKKKKKKHKKDKERKKKEKEQRARFIDDAAEDDDEDGDEEGESSRRRKKRSRFIDDAAEASDEDDDDDDDESDSDDELDAVAEADLSEEEVGGEDHLEIEGRRREAEEAEKARLQEHGLGQFETEEELQEFLKERFAGQRYDEAAGAGGAVDQQALMPTARDPSVWAVPCKAGKERDICVAMARKAVALSKRGEPLAITSVYCKPEASGFVYVEAYKELHVREALMGNHYVFFSRKPTLVVRQDMPRTVETRLAAEDALKPKSWTRVRGGPYKGDLAQVLEVDGPRGRVTVRLVPRVDYAAWAQRQRRARGEDAGDAAPRPRRVPAKGFSMEEARAAELQVGEERNALGGMDMVVHAGSTLLGRFRGGYLVKDMTAKGVRKEGLPQLDEVQRFAAAGTGEEGDGADLAALAAELPDVDDAGVGVVFRPGDKVRVSKGDMKNLTGVLVSVLEGLATLRPTTRGMEDAGPVEVQVRELTKWFDVGDRVVVDQGENAGCAGTVVGLEGHVVTLVLDGTAREVQAFARHLSRSDKRGGLLSRLGPYLLHDFVELDKDTFGVIVTIDPGVAHVLTNHGTVTAPDVRVVTERDIKRKLPGGKAQAQDARGFPVRAGDTVTVAEGPSKGAEGTVHCVHRGTLFVRASRTAARQGFSCVPAASCEVRNPSVGLVAGATRGAMPGSATPAAGAVPAGLASVRAGMARGGGGMASPGRAMAAAAAAGQERGRGRGRDHISGKVVRIINGPYMRMQGRVLDADVHQLTILLEAQQKKVQVQRAWVDDGSGRTGGGRGVGVPSQLGAGVAAARLGLGGMTPGALGGQTPGWGMGGQTPGWGMGGQTPAWGMGGQTPAAGGRTPAYGGMGTPSHGGATPAHGSKTPFHESVWNPLYRANKAATGATDGGGAGAGLGGFLGMGAAGVAPTGAPAAGAAAATAPRDYRQWTGMLVSVSGRELGVVEGVAGGEVRVLRGEASSDLQEFRAGGDAVSVDGATLTLARPVKGSLVKALGGSVAPGTLLRVRFAPQGFNLDIVCDRVGEGEGGTFTVAPGLLGVVPTVTRVS